MDKSTDNVTGIDNELSERFNTQTGRCELMQRYGHINTTYTGVNEEGESVWLHISQNGIILKTFQENGRVRVNYYDGQGYYTGEQFDGRWENGGADQMRER